MTFAGVDGITGLLLKYMYSCSENNLIACVCLETAFMPSNLKNVNIFPCTTVQGIARRNVKARGELF